MKYRHSDEVLSDGLRIRLLTAQRDMYISGFCLFLFALLRMVYSSMASSLKLEKSMQAMEKQAKGASAGYTKLLEEHDVLQKQMKKLSGFEDTIDGKGKGLEAILKENATLEKEVAKLNKTVATCEAQVEQVKKQADNQSTAYMKLLNDSTEKDSKLNDLKTKESQIADLKKKVEELTKERDGLKTQIQDYDFMFADAKKKAL
jgi:B-cell receptor-associated protein 31